MKLFYRHFGFILLCYFLFAINLFSQNNYYQINDTKNNDIIFSDNLNKGVYYLNLENQEIIRINPINSVAYRASISFDGKYVGFKSIIFKDDIPYQKPVLYDIKAGKIISLADWSNQSGVPSFSSNGDIVFTVGHQLHIMDKDLHERDVIELNNYVNLPSFSPDGNNIALNDENDQIYILSINGNQKVQISDNKNGYYEPTWSPDGRYIYYKSFSSEIYLFDIINNKTISLGYGKSLSWDKSGLSFLKYDFSSSGESFISSPVKFDLSTSSISISNPGKPEELQEITSMYSNNESIIYTKKDEDLIHIFSSNNSLQKTGENYLKTSIRIEKIHEIAIDTNINTKTPLRKITTDTYLPGFDTVYFHQVYDCRDDRYGIGSGCCGAASSLMGIMYYKILPEWGSYCSSPSYHLSRYSNYLTETYNYNNIKYDIVYARNDNYNPAYVGTGIYGWIYRNHLEETRGHMAELLNNHGINSSVDWSPTWDKVKREIDAGFPFVLLNSLTDAGHYIVWTGYVNENRTGIFNDPYGNRNYSTYLRDKAIRVKYDWPGTNNGYANLNTAHCFIYMERGAILSFSSSNLNFCGNADSLVTLKYSIKNTGVETINSNFKVKVYFSNDNKFDSSDSLICTKEYTGLIKKDSLTDIFNFKVLSSPITKTVYIFIKMDPENDLKAVIKTNPEMMLPVTVVGKPVVTALYPYPNSSMTFRRPAIYAGFDTTQQIDTSMIKLKINGIDYSGSLLKWKYKIILYAEKEYDKDTNLVTLYLKNSWGYDSTFTWTFYLSSQNGISDVKIPNTYYLAQNYPNPFNPTTKIEYKISKATNVKISIFNIIGQELETILNEYKTPGKYTLTFDGARYQSGVYFYKIETGYFSDIKKMLLIK
jgi:hypothetical protein